MNAEIRLVRNDNTPWGFRLTGGKDFESPFFVVKVMRKSIAEKAGLRVGDMVWAINYESTEPYTHKDSQRVIYESGNKVILNIRRGCPMVSGRGTPLPEYTEPLMEVDIPTPPPVYPVQPIYVPPYYPQQPPSPPKVVIENMYESTMMETMMYESTTFKSIETSTKEPEVESEEEEGGDVEAAWNITIKPSGRISQIEEIETPPSRPSSRASSRSRKSRSRSPSRERKKSLPKPILKVTTDVPNLVPKISTEIEETENVTIKKTTERKHSKGSTTVAGETTEAKTSKESQTSKEVKTSTDAKTSKEVKETTERQKEVKDRTQLTDEEIAEMMSGEAEVLDHGVIGVNFQKFIPKVDFIKDSEVLQALQEEHFRKEEPEEKQLAKQPTKRFSTFLQTPKRAIPKPKPRPDNVEDLPWKRKFLSPTPTSAKQQKINDTPPQQQQHQQQPPSEEEKETSWKADVTETMDTEESEVTKVINTENVKEISSTEEGQKDKVSEVADNVKDSEAQDSVICNGDIMDTTDVNDEDDDDSDEKKSVRFEDEIQDNEVVVEFSSKTQALQKSIKLDLENCKDDFERQLAQIQHQLSSMLDMPEEIKTYLLEIQQQLFNVVKVKTTVDQEKAERERREQEEEERRKAAEEEARRIAEEKEEERRKAEEEEVRRKAEEEANKNVQKQHTNENESHAATYNNQEGVEYAVAPPRRKEVLQTPQVRPIVLPGGRKWRKPEDAFTEEFIAETLVGMSEVLVGSTIGVNFCKYVPPKFDTSNSAVYRLIQENEARCKGIAGRPEKVLAEEDYCAPISKRHFYAAKLAEMANENRAQQPLEPGA